jgi:tetratricopeptide (TPR) repeat protein
MLWEIYLEFAVLSEPVFVGREKELEELQRHLDSAMAGRGNTILVSAEAGIGKTRLVAEFLNSLKQRQIIKLSGWCLFKPGVPYFPFIEAFSNYYSTLNGASEKEELELTSWLKEPAKNKLSVNLQYLSPQALKDQTFAAVAKALHSMAAENTIVLLIEDIHWADSASLSLLNYIARVVNDSEKILVLATFRTEELTNTSEGYPHQLVQTLVMMRREELFTEINLPRLTASNVARIAESMLAGKVHQGLIDKLAVESEGNPLFVVESLRLLHERKIIVPEKNEWYLTANELGIPPKIKDIIIQRLASLNFAQRRILDAASVIGEEFDAGLLSAVTGEDSLEVLETLNVIAHSTSLVFADENRYRFDHARSKEIIYEALSEPLKHGYHKRIAETLENSHNATLPLRDLAYHYDQAGNREKAIKYSLKAGQDALLKFSNTEAIRHFLYVSHNVFDQSTTESRTALEGLGDAYAASSMFGEAIKTFDELADSENGTTKLRAIRKATDAAYAKGDMPDLLVDYAKKATETGLDDSLEMARIIANRGRAWGWSGHGNFEMDLADYQAALQVFEEENSVADVAEVRCRIGSISFMVDSPKEKSLGQLLFSVAIFRELGDTRKEVEARRWLEQGFSGCGLFEEDKRALAEVLKDCERLGIFNQLVIASVRLSMYYADDGKFDDALAIAFKGLEYSKKTDAAWAQAFAYANLVRLYSLLGDLKQADVYFNILSDLPANATLGIYARNLVSLARAMYFAAKGCWQKANQYFDELLTQPIPPHMIAHNSGLIWALEKQGRFEEAKIQRTERQKVILDAEERFGHANIQLSVMMPRKVSVGEEFEIRVDLVNVGRKPGELVKVRGLVFPFGISQLPSCCSIEDDFIKTNRVDSFKVETIKIRASFQKEGIFKLEPSVFWVDELSNCKESDHKPIHVTVRPIQARKKLSIETLQQKGIIFDSVAAEKAFRYLVGAFKLDYSSKMPLEESGWRTFMQVVKGAKVSKHSLYGQSGHGGEALSNLVSLGLIESKQFSGERGRGGHALKLRISQEQINRNCVF